MITRLWQPWLVSSFSPADFDHAQKSMIDPDTAFHYRLRNLHLCWSCPRRPRKTCRTGRTRQRRLDSSRRSLLGGQLRTAAEYYVDIRSHETVRAALLQKSISRQYLQCGCMDNDQCYWRLDHCFLFRELASMLSDMAELGSLRSPGLFVHQHQHDVLSTVVDGRAYRYDDPLTADSLHLGTSNAGKAQGRCERYLPSWNPDSPFWDRKARRLLPNHSRGSWRRF